MSHGIVIDLVTIVVMTVAVVYAIRLNQSLMKARDGRGELTQLIGSLTNAMAQADTAIRTMKVTAAEYDLSLQKQIAVSRGLIEELSMINDTSNTIANRLERLAPLARGGVESGTSRAYELEERPHQSPSRPTQPLRAERPITSSSELRPSAKGATDDVKTRPVAKTAAPSEPAPVTPPSNVRNMVEDADPAKPARSRAERELFAAIETLRKGRPS